MKFDSDVVIGMEIHVSLNTKRKLFCSCMNKPNDSVNKNICPVCIGHPGSRPVLNVEAVHKALSLTLAFDFKIAPKLLFSRKTYFYPDLAKNFQITQYEEPIGANGTINLGHKSIGIERIHIEEDPGTIERKNSFSLIDYNRSGTPLCEIVTKPEISSPAEARQLIRKLVLVMKYIDVWDKNVGNIKADLNISIRETNYKKVEIKGVSGFKEIEDAIEYEIRRQQSDPSSILAETRSYDPKHKITESMRKKETEEDYGYIYESDILPRKISQELIDNVKNSMPELYDEKVDRYISIGLDKEVSESISSIPNLAKIMDDFVNNKIDSKIKSENRASKNVQIIDFSKFLKKEVISLINDNLLSEDKLLLDNIQNSVIEIYDLFYSRKINNHSARTLLKEMNNHQKFEVESFAKDNGMFIETSVDLDSICSNVISENENAVNDYKSGKYWAVNYLVGQVMKKLQGKAMPDEVKSILTDKLDNEK